MYNVQLNQTLRRIIQTFYLAGIWRKNDESKFHRTGRKFCYMVYYFLFQIFLVTCAVLSDSATQTIFLIAVEILLSVVTIKLIYLLWKKAVICEFAFEPIIAHYSTFDNDTFAAVNRKIKNFTNFAYAYSGMLGIAFLLYIFSTLPMFSNGKKLPFFISFTLVGKYSELLYWITYAFVMSEILVGYTCSAFNIIIWYIMFNYSVEYEVLGIQIRNLGMSKSTDFVRSQPSTATNYRRDLIRLIKTHQKIFQYFAFSITI